MFILILILLAAAAAIHARFLPERTPNAVGELSLLYLLVGYCGFPTLIASVAALIWPDRAADMVGFPQGNPFQGFATYAFLAMSLMSILTLRYRGTALVGPAVCWAVLFAGATFVHIQASHAGGSMGHGGVLVIFATHGLISVLLLVALLASGLVKKKGASRAQ